MKTITQIKTKIASLRKANGPGMIHAEFNSQIGMLEDLITFSDHDVLKQLNFTESELKRYIKENNQCGIIFTKGSLKSLKWYMK